MKNLGVSEPANLKVRQALVHDCKRGRLNTVYICYKLDYGVVIYYRVLHISEFIGVAFKPLLLFKLGGSSPYRDSLFDLPRYFYNPTTLAPLIAPLPPVVDLQGRSANGDKATLGRQIVRGIMIVIQHMRHRRVLFKGPSFCISATPGDDQKR